MSNNLTRLPGNTSPRARPELDRGRAPDSLPLEHILMMLRRSQTQEQELEQFISRQYDPRSADFHKLADTATIRRAIRAFEQDIRKVTQWLMQKGIQTQPGARRRPFC